MDNLPEELAKLMPTIVVPESVKTKQEEKKLLGKKKEPEVSKKKLRYKGSEVWEDPSMDDWPKDDYRVFVGDLGNEVNEDMLVTVFRRYPSFQRARVVRNKYNNKTRGYGFLSFGNSEDFLKAIREMNGKYLGNRPIRLKKSDWEKQNFDKGSLKGMKLSKSKNKASKKLARERGQAE